MRKGNRVLSSAFLLGTTCLVTPALADNVITVGPSATFTSSSQVNVNALSDFNNVSTINDNTIGNRIGATGVGASTGARVDQAITGHPTQTDGSVTVIEGNQVNFTTVGQEIKATNLGGQVAADVGTGSLHFGGSASIAGGIANQIGVTGVGASTTAGVSQSIAVGLINPAANPIGFGTNQIGPTVADVTAVNDNNTSPATTATVTSTGTFNAPSAPAFITTGIGNSIVVGAGGASASASVTQAIANSSVDLRKTGATDYENKNLVAVQDISALNQSGVGLTSATGYFTPSTNGVQTGALISGGIGNSIMVSGSGAAAGASVSASLALSTVDHGQNHVSFVTIDATNNGAVTGTGNFNPTANGSPTPDNVVGAKITAGIGNSIGASASGASATANVTNSLSGSSVTHVDNQVIGTLTIIANNNAGGIVNAIGNFSPTNEYSTGALISGGIGGSISATGIGASAGASVVQSLTSNGGTQSAFVNGTNNVTYSTIAATNKGAVEADGNFKAGGLADFGITTAKITAGPGVVGNTIGATAVGATATASVTHSVLSNTGASGGTNSVIGGDTTATNDTAGVVANGSFIPVGTSTNANAANIVGGIRGSIGATAIGASAGASVSQSLVSSSGDQAVNVVNLNPTSTIKAETKGAATEIKATATFTPTGTGITAQIDGGLSNSIGANAVGASASASVSQSVSASVSSGTFDNQVKSSSGTEPAIVATNASKVTAQGSFNGVGNGTMGALILNGIGNSVTATAIGASGAASVGQTLDSSRLSGVGTNKVTYSTILVTNNGTVGSTGDFKPGSNASTGNVAAKITDGIGNSIGATAVGASATAGVTQLVSAALSSSVGTTNNVTGGDVSGINHAGVVATGNFMPATGTTPTGFTAALVSGGIGGSIAATAIGASAGASVNQTLDSTGGSANQGTNSVTLNGGSTISALNQNSGTGPGAPDIVVKAVGTFTATTGGFAANIDAGVSNSIGVTAVGASASASINQSINSPVTGGVGTYSNSISNLGTGAVVQATNYNTVGSTSLATPDGTFNGAVTIGGASSTSGTIGNSITVASIGASASAGITQSINQTGSGSSSGGSAAGNGNSVSVLSITALNSANTTLTTAPSVNANGLFTGAATIGGGSTGTTAIANSIGVQAIGASASASISARIVLH